MKFYLYLLKNRNEKLLLPKIIRYFEGTKYNHVEVVCEFHNAFPEFLKTVGLSFGAVYPKSRWCTTERLERNYEIIEKIPLKLAVSESEAYDVLWSLCGKPYSVAQLVIIYAKIFLTKSLKWLPFVKLNLKARLICTELAGNFMQEACQYKIDISTETLRLVEVEKLAREALVDSQTQITKL